VTPIQWGEKTEKVHSGIGESAKGLYTRLQYIATSFAASGHKIILVGHSLGAGVAALLAWLLRKEYAPPGTPTTDSVQASTRK
jgi:acetyl esterase/lipase